MNNMPTRRQLRKVEDTIRESGIGRDALQQIIPFLPAVFHPSVKADEIDPVALDMVLGINRSHPTRLMMATLAFHITGDLSRQVPELCRVYAEFAGFYVGCWVTGFRFYNVLFPKRTTREPKTEELFL
jgi:hypothetical protein